MRQENPADTQDQENNQSRPPHPTGSTRFRNKDFAEQREHWPDEDERR